MNNTESITIQGALAALMTMISYYCGIVAAPIIVLIAVMVIDYVTGMVAAWKVKKLSSKKGAFGIAKKVCYLALVCVGMGVDWLIYSGLRQVGVAWDYTIFFGVVVTVWLVINELISILENLKKIGVPLPKFLIALIKRLKITTEKKFENEEEKSND